MSLEFVRFMVTLYLRHVVHSLATGHQVHWDMWDTHCVRGCALC